MSLPAERHHFPDSNTMTTRSSFHPLLLLHTSRNAHDISLAGKLFHLVDSLLSVRRVQDQTKWKALEVRPFHKSPFSLSNPDIK